MKLRNLAFGAMVVFLIGQNAFSGELLKLRVGTVRPASIAARWDLVQNNNAPRAFVVQFRQHITNLDRQNVASLGARVLRYLPDDALVVMATSQVAQSILQSSNAIASLVPFDPAWKLAPELAPVNVFSAHTDGLIHVRLFPSGSNNEASRLQRQAILTISHLDGVTVVDSQERSLVLRAPLRALEAIARVEAVEWIQPQPTFESMVYNDGALASETQPTAGTPGDYSDLSGYESGTKVMNFDAAWARGFDGRGQVVGMGDTGLDSGDTATIHPDFNAKVDKGLIFGLFSKSWGDPMGHGTHVAGSVLGTGFKSGGRLQGGANQAHIVAEGMWSPMLGGLSVPSKLADLFGQAYDQGARIHTNSWGSNTVGVYDSFAQQVDEFSAAHPDMLIVFAAGNSGMDLDKDGRIDPNSIGTPATAKNVLTVGASKNLVASGGIQKMMKELRNGTDHWGVEPIASSRLSETAAGLAAFSSRGPTADGRLKPEIVAPGTNILSTRSQDPKADPLWGAYNEAYVWSGGTSMATPLTAGGAAVLRQYLVEDRKIANPSSALMKAALIHTAYDMYPGQFGEIGKASGQEILTRRPNIDEGYGRVDMDKATNLSKALLVDEKSGLATGETLAYPIQVKGNAKLVATMVYTDAAAASGAATALVNDLDLSLVRLSDGQETTLNDHLNNSEMIETDVVSGNYEVRVKGTNVPQGPFQGKQPFALVISVQ